MKLSICIVQYFNEPALERFLKSLFQFRPDCDFEVLIANNGSSKEFSILPPEVRLISPPRNLGFGAALNLVAREAQGEYLFLGNCDLEAEHFSFSALLQFLEKNPNAGIVGPKLIYPDKEVQQSCRRFPSILDLIAKRLDFLPFFRSRSDRYLLRDRDVSKPLQVDWLVGAAMMMPRKLFLDLHGFDERFFLFFEDTDLCRRVRISGYEVWYVPDSLFIHTSKIRLSESPIPLMCFFKKAFWIHLFSAFKYFVKYREL